MQDKRSEGPSTERHEQLLESTRDGPGPGHQPIPERQRDGKVQHAADAQIREGEEALVHRGEMLRRDHAPVQPRGTTDGRVRERKCHERRRHAAHGDRQHPGTASQIRADLLPVVTDREAVHEQQLPRQDREHRLELCRGQLHRDQAVADVHRPTEREQCSPADAAKQNQHRSCCQHEPHVETDDFKRPRTVPKQRQIADVCRVHAERIVEPGHRRRIPGRDGTDVDASEREGEDRERHCDKRHIERQGAAAQSLYHRKPSVAEQPGTIHHAEHHARQDDEDFGSCDDPEPLVREPAQRRRALGVVDNDAHHRDAAQEVDPEVSGRRLWREG